MDETLIAPSADEGIISLKIQVGVGGEKGKEGNFFHLNSKI
jgi:hypothetical protein